MSRKTLQWPIVASRLAAAMLRERAWSTLVRDVGHLRLQPLRHAAPPGRAARASRTWPGSSRSSSLRASSPPAWDESCLPDPLTPRHAAGNKVSGAGARGRAACTSLASA
eukprot:1279679-Pyramimonas_sp.AAC.1